MLREIRLATSRAAVRTGKMPTLVVLLVAHSACAVQTAAEVKARLLEAYGDASMRPSISVAAAAAAARNESCHEAAPPDPVGTQLYIDRFHYLDQRHQSFGFEGYLRLWWQDPRLAFNAKNCTMSKLSLTRSESRSIWRPGLYWEKAIKITLPKSVEMIDSGAGELLEVSPDGSVFWSQQMSMRIACEMDLYKLPFDTQHCEYLVGLYAQTATEVQLAWKKDVDGQERTALAGATSACMPEFIVTSIEQDSPVMEYEYNYTYARAVVSFSRKPDTLLNFYLVPGLLLVFVSMLGFFIDPKATPARVTLGVIGILAVLANMTSLTNSLPPGVDMTWLQQFLFVSFGFNACAFFEQVAVSFGLQAAAWREAERRILEINKSWKCDGSATRTCRASAAQCTRHLGRSRRCTARARQAGARTEQHGARRGLQRVGRQRRRQDYETRIPAGRGHDETQCAAGGDQPALRHVGSAGQRVSHAFRSAREDGVALGACGERKGGGRGTAGRRGGAGRRRGRRGRRRPGGTGTGYRRPR